MKTFINKRIFGDAERQKASILFTITTFTCKWLLRIEKNYLLLLWMLIFSIKKTQLPLGKIATDTETQIENLTKRGMLLDYPNEKIVEILLDIGYYRLGFYWHPFETGIKHNFKPGTKFSDVIKLYYLDVDLRHFIFKYTSRIEFNFRTKVIYYVSNKYNQSPTWFADPSIVNQHSIDYLNNTIYTLSFINQNKTIKKHHKKYINDKYAPAWKTLEFLTFGNVYNIFKAIKDRELKEQIANEFGIYSLDKFYNLLKVVIDIRNSCAHGDVLFDYRTPKGISVIPAFNFNNNDRSSLDSCLKVISYFLGYISKNRQIEMDNAVNKILSGFEDNQAIRNVITNCINYKY